MDINPADVYKLIVTLSDRLKKVLEGLVSFCVWSSSGTTIRVPEPLSSPAMTSLDSRDCPAGKDMRRSRTGVHGNRRTSRVLWVDILSPTRKASRMRNGTS